MKKSVGKVINRKAYIKQANGEYLSLEKSTK